MQLLRARNGGRSIFLALLLGLVLVGLYVFTNSESEAFPGMPEEQRAYWEWVRNVDKVGPAAVDSGFALLERHPTLHGLYGRLADLCTELDAAASCAGRIEALHPPHALSMLYRDAASVRLDGKSNEAWLRIASSPHIDPAVARQVVDAARRSPDVDLLDSIEDAWSEAVATDSTQAGAAFGLGYAAVLRHEWEVSEPLLKHVIGIRPDDPHAYRELGRMYFFQGDFGGFSASLEAAIERARRSYDLEQGLILQGNLGLGYLQWKGDLEKAGEIFEAALSQSRLLHMRESEGYNYYRLANVRGRQHRYEEGMALLDSAFVRYEALMPERIAEVLVLRGMLLKETYQYVEAANGLEQALSAASENGDVPAEVQALIALVDVKSRTGAYAAAQEYGEQALHLATMYGMTDYEIASRSVLGDAARHQGDHEAAHDHFIEALDTAREMENVEREREMYEQLGVTALRIGDLSRAHRYFQELRRLVYETDDSLAQARALYWIGASYSEYGNFAEGLRHLEEAQRVLPASGASRLEVLALRDKAVALVNMGRTDAARGLLEKALKIAEDEDDRRFTDVLLGHVLVRQRHYGDALDHFDRAEKIEARSPWTATRWYTLYGKALARWRLGDRLGAEQHFIEAVAVIEKLRDALLLPENRAHFIGDKVAVYESYSAFLEESDRNADAFAIKERVRSRQLVDLLYTSQVSRSDGDARARALQWRMGALDRSISRSEAGDAAADGADPYRSRRAAYLRREREAADRLYRTAEHADPRGDRIRTFFPVGVDSVQSILGPDEALIAFNLRHRRDNLQSEHGATAYIVLKDAVRRVSLPIEAVDVVEGTRFLRAAVESSGQLSEFTSTAQRLYRGLIEPVRAVLPASVRHLHLVPEGVLHYLPFAALVDDDGRFLVEHYSLSVTPSATVLKLSRDRNPRQWSRMLLLADPYGRLPGARREVLRVAQQDPARRHVLAGEDVAQDVLESAGRNYDIIHVATHGTFNRRAPWNSHLELHDDVLTAEEIGGLELNAYLVTLSACETALAGGLTADVPEGDEWVGLNQAFLTAGTPTVMASLWPIDDAVSSQLMVGFYDALGADGKAAALARIQRAFLADETTAHPFYWAAFTVIGDPL